MEGNNIKTTETNRWKILIYWALLEKQIGTGKIFTLHKEVTTSDNYLHFIETKYLLDNNILNL